MGGGEICATSAQRYIPYGRIAQALDIYRRVYCTHSIIIFRSDEVLLV